MHKSFSSIALFLTCGMLYGQTGSLLLSSAAGSAGGSVTLNISLVSSGGAPSQVQWTATYSAGSVASITASPGATATSVGKTVSCTGGSGSYACVVSGTNTTVIPNGVVASLTLTLAPGASSFSVGLSNVSAADGSGGAIAVSGTGGTVTVTGGTTSGGGTGSNSAPAQLTALSCTPSSLASGDASTCTAQLSAAAPAGGATVNLTSSSPSSLVAPGSVTIPAVSQSGVFAAWATTIRSTSTAALNASYSGKTASASITLLGPAPSLQSLTCSPSSFLGGSTSTCTVMLTGAAPAGGMSVALSSNNAVAKTPASVSVASGAASATFTVTTSAVTSAQSAVITASSGGTSQTATLTLTASTLQTLTCSPVNLLGGTSSTCTVTLSGAAPAGGLSVALSFNNAVAKTPASLSVASGAASATFTVTTSAVTSGQSAVITASSGGTSLTVTFTVTAPAATPRSGIQCTLPTVNGMPIMGNSSSAACTVTMSSASSSAQTVKLSSSTAALTVPGSVTVPSGARTVGFTASSGTLSALTQNATITASANSVTKGFSLTLSVLVSALTCTPSAVRAPNSTSCTVTLSQNAPSIAVVTVSDNSPNLTVPVSVSVPAGAASAAFTGKVGDAPYSLVTISAALSGIAQTATVSVGAVALKSLSCTPSALTAGKSSTCTITLVAPAPSGGETVTVTTSSAKLSAPSSSTVPAGWSLITFTVTALAGYSGPVQVTVKIADSSASATISDAKTRNISGTGGSSGVPQLACSPHSVEPGAVVTCGIHLLAAAASSEGVQISLRSSHPSLKIPAVVESRPNQASLTFQAVVDSMAPEGPVSVNASLGSSEAEDRILVQRSTNPVLTVPGKQRALIGSKLNFDVAASSSSGVPPSMRASSLPPGASFDPSTGTFEWTPAAGQSGRWRVSFTATGEAGRSTTAEVAIEAGSGAPQVESVQNAASGSTDLVCTSGSLASIRGEWLASGTASEPVGARELAGARVRANGKYLPVVFASSAEVAFVCPEAAAGAEVGVAVETAAGESAPLKLAIRDSAPGIFTVDGGGRGPATATILNGGRLAMPRNYLYPGQPAQPGDSLSINMTGLPANIEASSLLVKIGDIPVPADFVRPLAGSAGVLQVGVRIPRAAQLGDSVPVGVEVLSGRTASVSQTVPIAIEQ